MINETDNDTGQELVRKSGTSLQTTESLPVLAAFSDFIKEEQRRSRNRMLIMGFLFTIMILVVIGAGVFVGTAFYNQVHADLRQTKRDLNSYHIKSEIEKSKAKEKLSRIQALASNIAYTISQQEKALQATQHSIDSSKNSYQQELSDMKLAIDSLSLENKELKKNSEQANIQLPQLTAQINDLLSIVTNPVILPTNNPVAQPTPTVITEKAEIKETSALKELPKIENAEFIEPKESTETNEPTEINESTEIKEPTNSIELNIEDQDDNSDIMMLLPTLE